MINDFKDKKILVLGLGLNKGGVGSARFFARHGAKVRVTDLKNNAALKPSLNQLKDFPDIEYTLGEHKFEDIDWADLIIRNPAIKPDNPYLSYAQDKGKQVEMDMGIFLQFVKPHQIIAITGTKGKSTTASLIYDVLHKTVKSHGVKLAHARGVSSVIFAGNIGTSVLDTISQITPDTLIILEVSSFQLEAFSEHQFGPHYALITNIYPDHLNYYKTMDDYIQSKKLITKHQTKDDFLFLWKDDSVTNSNEFLRGIHSQIIHFSKADLPKNLHPILKGEHNLNNMAAILAVVKQLGVDEKLALKIMAEFKGVEFRMQFVKEWNGVKIYNDTTATMPEAAIEALKTLASHMSSGNSNVILIAGGMNKGLDYQDFAKAIDKYAKAVFLIAGDATDDLKSSIINHKSKIKGTYNNLKELLKDIKKVVESGDVILFSPGATSFNFWQNEFDRGRKFNEAVDEAFK